MGHIWDPGPELKQGPKRTQNNVLGSHLGPRTGIKARAPEHNAIAIHLRPTHLGRIWDPGPELKHGPQRTQTNVLGSYLAKQEWENWSAKKLARIDWILKPLVLVENGQQIQTKLLDIETE